MRECKEHHFYIYDGHIDQYLDKMSVIIDIKTNSLFKNPNLQVSQFLPVYVPKLKAFKFSFMLSRAGI